MLALNKKLPSTFTHKTICYDNAVNQESIKSTHTHYLLCRIFLSLMALLVLEKRISYVILVQTFGLCTVKFYATGHFANQLTYLHPDMDLKTHRFDNLQCCTIRV